MRPSQSYNNQKNLNYLEFKIKLSYKIIAIEFNIVKIPLQLKLSDKHESVLVKYRG